MNTKIKTLLIVFAITIVTNTFGQSNVDCEEKPYIEVTGTADLEVIPDEIFINIIIREKSVNKEKSTVESQEEKLKISLKEIGIDIKISGKDTDGALAIFVQTSLSQGKGTPLHIHTNQDEIFNIIKGSYYFQVGEEKYNLTKGDSIFLPRNVPHAWTQVSKKGKMNVIVQPAGKLEEFLITVAALDHEPTKEEMNKIFTDNEMQVVGPPLEIKKK